MQISGVIVVKKNNVIRCTIDGLSDEFKDIIRAELQGIVNGYAEAMELEERYTYQYTLLLFLDRYNTKSENTKKGMVGELLSHILLPCIQDDLKSISIWKNKEERSIKKGFDIIYHSNLTNCLWYTEVKSGNQALNVNCNDANKTLLNNAYDGIKDMLLGGRTSLWDSALIDAKLVLENPKLTTVRKLLSSDCPSQAVPDTVNKKIILCSVLYNETLPQVSEELIDTFYLEKINLKEFEEILIFSFAKKTYEAIADFIRQESLQ